MSKFSGYESLLTFNGIQLVDLSDLIASMVSPDYMKRFNGGDLRRAQFYDCIYNYTHQKLYRALKDPVLSFLFGYFVKSGEFKTFASTDETLMKNPEIYTSTAEFFVENADVIARTDFLNYRTLS